MVHASLLPLRLYPQDMQVSYAQVDLSAQPAGADMVWDIEVVPRAGLSAAVYGVVVHTL